MGIISVANMQLSLLHILRSLGENPNEDMCIGVSRMECNVECNVEFKDTAQGQKLKENA